MKKVNIFFTLLTLALVIVSCETYDDYNTNRPTVVGFTTATKNINGVPEGGTKTDSVNLFVSDVSATARTYTVITLPVDSLGTAANNYTFESTVTFPANERQVVFYVTAVDNSITTDRTFFRLAIKGENDVVSGGRVLIGLKN